MTSFNPRVRLGAAAAALALTLTGCGGAKVGATANAGSNTGDSAKCGTINLAVNAWVGYEANAAVIAYVAEKNLGCKVVKKNLAEQVSWQGFSTGAIDAIVENWGHEDLVKTSESGGQGQLLDGDPAFVTNDAALVKNLKLNYKVVFSGSEAALIQSFRQAEKNQKPMIGYFYEPQWFLTEVPLVKVNLPAYKAGCDADVAKVAAGLVRRQVHLHQRHLGQEPLRLVEVPDHRLLVLLGLPEALDQRGLGAREHDLVVQLQVLHQRGVVGDEGRVPVEQLALSTGLRGLEQVGVLVEVLPVGDVRVRLHERRRDVPADLSEVAGQAGVLGDLLLGDVLLHQVLVAPVLHDSVDRAGTEALPGDLLGEVLLDHLAAEVLLGDVGDHGRVGLVTDPGVDGQVDRPALGAVTGVRAGVGGRPDLRATAAGQGQSQCGRCRTEPHPRVEARHCSVPLCLPLQGGCVTFRVDVSAVCVAAEVGPFHHGLRHAVQGDAEQRDGQAGRQSLAEQAVLREALDHVVPEGSGADQATDHDHRQHVDHALVRGQRDGAHGHRQLHLGDDLPGARAGRRGRLDRAG